MTVLTPAPASDLTLGFVFETVVDLGLGGHPSRSSRAHSRGSPTYRGILLGGKFARQSQLCKLSVCRFDDDIKNKVDTNVDPSLGCSSIAE